MTTTTHKLQAAQAKIEQAMKLIESTYYRTVADSVDELLVELEPSKVTACRRGVQQA